MEVLALLAKHELTAVLEVIGLRADDEPARQAAERVRQKQRRLEPEQVAALVAQYQDGESIDRLAQAFDINRTTVIRHLEVSGVARRRLVRKMNDQNVADATTRYAEGYSLAAVAKQFDVCGWRPMTWWK